MAVLNAWGGPRLAKDVLREWLVERGFAPMQEPTKGGDSWGDGYFTKGNVWVEDTCFGTGIDSGVILFRGGRPGGMAKDKLGEVAALLSQLGVAHEWGTNKFGIPFLVVTVSDVLYGDR